MITLNLVQFYKTLNLYMITKFSVFYTNLELFITNLCIFTPIMQPYVSDSTNSSMDEKPRSNLLTKTLNQRKWNKHWTTLIRDCSYLIFYGLKFNWKVIWQLFLQKCKTIVKMWLKFLAFSDLLIGCYCDPKHFLVIIADDFGWGDVSMHGTGGMLKLLFFFNFKCLLQINFFSWFNLKGIKTPNLDKLASTGTNLTHYYTQNICTPTRYFWFTILFL